MSDMIKLSWVAINCPDAGVLATFYADIAGGQIIFLDPAWATVNGVGGRIDFQTVPDNIAPTWPEPTVPSQLHLDFHVDDLAAAEEGPPSRPATVTSGRCPVRLSITAPVRRQVRLSSTAPVRSTGTRASPAA